MEKQQADTDILFKGYRKQAEQNSQHSITAIETVTATELNSILSAAAELAEQS